MTTQAVRTRCAVPRPQVHGVLSIRSRVQDASIQIQCVHLHFAYHTHHAVFFALLQFLHTSKAPALTSIGSSFGEGTLLARHANPLR
jgi:hypothetical protein